VKTIILEKVDLDCAYQICEHSLRGHTWAGPVLSSGRRIRQLADPPVPLADVGKSLSDLK
jgi:hypothetical protein